MFSSTEIPGVVINADNKMITIAAIAQICYAPKDSLSNLKDTTNAASITFSFPSGLSAGVGVDYYSESVKLFEW